MFLIKGDKNKYLNHLVVFMTAIALLYSVVYLSGCKSVSKSSVYEENKAKSSEVTDTDKADGKNPDDNEDDRKDVNFQPMFTDIALNTSVDEMLEKEGKPVEEYPSFYNGTVYRFDKKSMGDVDGSVKYMTDENGSIACIAFLYESDNPDDVKSAYDMLHGQLVAVFGESGNASVSQGTYGDIWYFDDVHIQISAVATNDYNGLQVSYMDSKYSLKDEVEKKKSLKN